MPISSTGSRIISQRVSTRVTAKAPSPDPTATSASGQRIRRKSTLPLRQKFHRALAVPTLPGTLLVAMAATGFSPTDNRAGSEISPPPPAMASMKPAITDATPNRAMISGVRSNTRTALRSRWRYSPAGGEPPRSGVQIGDEALGAGPGPGLTGLGDAFADVAKTGALGQIGRLTAFIGGDQLVELVGQQPALVDDGGFVVQADALTAHVVDHAAIVHVLKAPH